MRYAEVAVNAPVRSTFHYHIPPELEGQIAPGHLVRVAFGTAAHPGVVLALHDDSPVDQTKPIIARLDPDPVVTPRQIALAQWMSARCLAPIGPCLWLMLPPGIAGQRDILVTLADDQAAPDETLQAEIAAALKRRGPMRGSQLRASFKKQPWQQAVSALEAAGIVTSESILGPPRVRPRKVQAASLAIHPDRLDGVAHHLGKRTRESDLLQLIAAEGGLLSRQYVLDLPGIGRGTINRLMDEGLVDEDGDTLRLAIPDEAVEEALCHLRQGEDDLHILRVLARERGPVDVSWVYAQTGARLADLKRLESLGMIWLGERETWRDSLAEMTFVPSSPPRLTAAQHAVWDRIRDGMQKEDGGVYLLHGVTGSGKTELYLRAIEQALIQGRQALLLVPEIALTAQTVRRVAARFPGRLVVIDDASGDGQPDPLALMHSRLSPGERYDTWRRTRAGRVDVIVGTRSALFMPLPNPGVIILDESHDHSYKQSPPLPAPHYDTRDVAEYLAREHNATLILGSATPDLETYFRAQRGDITYLRLPDRIMGHRVRIEEQAGQTGLKPRYAAPGGAADALHIELPPVQIVDMRDELKAGNTGMFSRTLLDALGETLARREQAILFLNRRGTATYVFCRDCGYVAACPRCSTPLTFHSEGQALHCHHCGFQQAAPQTCPQCASQRIRFFGAGTQQVEQTARASFPQATILRWDADTSARPGQHDIILTRFASHKADVLIGTQMIAKGLDLPLVTLVGVVSADPGLALPDFRAGERVFQTLMQVAGRAGRGLLGGRVILQTYQPGHYAITAAAQHDYHAFYQREIDYRRQLGYPPFRRLARILFQYDREIKARTEAERTASLLKNRLEQLKMTGTEIIGPAPCFFGKINRMYRWHVLLRGPDPAQALDGLDFARGWQVDIDPLDVL